MASNTLPGHLIAVDATEYQILRAAAYDSAENWAQSQAYKRELMGAHKTNRVLFALLSLVVMGAFILVVSR